MEKPKQHSEAAIKQWKYIFNHMRFIRHNL